MSTVYQNFRSQLEQLCKERELRFADLAEAIGVVTSRISHMVKNAEQRLQPETIERIAFALGVEPEHFDLYVALKLPMISMQHPGLISLGRDIISGGKTRTRVVKSKRIA